MFDIRKFEEIRMEYVYFLFPGLDDDKIEFYLSKNQNFTKMVYWKK